jgi:hypothetical protein
MADSHRDIGILARASWDLVRASRELVRSNRAMRELLTQHSKRLDRGEGPA